MIVVLDAWYAAFTVIPSSLSIDFWNRCRDAGIRVRF